METVTFQCDFCGMKSEEESAVWRRPRCSVELVLRGRRFQTMLGSHSLYGVPFSAPDIEDERWAATLCDRCMRRIAALFGLGLETAEEARWRQEELASRVASEVARVAGGGLPTDSGMRGKMVDQFETPPHPAGRSIPTAPVSVVQYPTPKTIDPEKVAGEGKTDDDASPGTLEKNEKKGEERETGN